MYSSFTHAHRYVKERHSLNPTIKYRVVPEGNKPQVTINTSSFNTVSFGPDLKQLVNTPGVYNGLKSSLFHHPEELDFFSPIDPKDGKFTKDIGLKFNI